MGLGGYDVNERDVRLASRASAGIPVFHHDSAIRSGRVATAVHDSLDPKKLNADGLNIREARDSDEHPNATPIAIIFDVTGSMGHIPTVLQKNLGQLQGVLQRKGYVEDPQILFGAVGDAYSDRVPLQIGQFESDLRMDEQLEAIYLEGGGGGGNHESYQLAAYYLARHAELDCLKRGKKGYCFFIGDERLYDSIDRRQVEALIGDTLQENLSTAEVFEELKQKFEVFFLFAVQGSYAPGAVLYDDLAVADPYGHGKTGVCYWRDLLGQNALTLEDAGAVCETVALTIGLMEGVIDLDSGMDDLAEAGSDMRAIAAAGKALAVVAAGSGTSVATAEGELPEAADDEGADRL